MQSEETCENCQRIIGALEEGFVWEDKVVCRECHSILSGFTRKTASIRNIPRWQKTPADPRCPGRSIHIMGFLLPILAAIAFVLGAAILSEAKSAIHEIEAFILFLIGAVFMSGAAILDSINLAAKKLEKSLKDSNE